GPSSFDGFSSPVSLSELISLPAASWSGTSAAKGYVDYTLPGSDAALFFVILGAVEAQRKRSYVATLAGLWIVVGISFMQFLPLGEVGGILTGFAMPLSLLTAFFLEDIGRRGNALWVVLFSTLLYAVLLN